MASTVNTSIVDFVRALLLDKRWCREPVRVLIYNNFDLTTNSILLLVFEEIAEPKVVVKLCKNVPVLQREFQNLDMVYRLCEDFVPRPLFFQIVDEYGMLGMQALRGRRVAKLEQRIATLPLVVSQLILFHKKVRGGFHSLSELRNFVLEPFRDIKALAYDDEVQRFYATLADSLERALQDQPFPEVPQHGDFYFDNILLDGNHIHLLDWEDFGECSMPAFDLFCLFLNFYDNDLETGSNNFFENKNLLSCIKRSFTAYFDAFNLPYELAFEICVYTLLRQFLYARRLGRTSERTLERRLIAFPQKAEQFKQLFSCDENVH